MSVVEATNPRSTAIEARRAELLTVKEFADLVRRHPEYVRELCRRGKLPGACRVGGQWLIDVAVAIRPVPLHVA